MILDSYGIPVLSKLSRDLTHIVHVLSELNKDTTSGRIKALFSPVLLVKPIADQIQDCINRLN